MKNLNPEIKGMWKCACGSTKLKATVEVGFALVDGKLEEVGQVGDLHYGTLTCEACGFSGPGFLFSRTLTLESTALYLVDWLQDHEPTDRLEGLIKLLFGLGLVVRDDGVCWTVKSTENKDAKP